MYLSKGGDKMRSLRGLTALMIVAGLMLASCGSGATEVPTEEPAEATEMPTEEPEQAEGFSLKVGIAQEPGTLDPRSVRGDPARSFIFHIIQPLVQNDDDGEMYGVLAESWETIDNLHLRFHLREGIEFHNGEPFTAEAVKYTIETILDPTTDFVQTREWLRAVDSVTIEDDYTAVLNLNQPWRPTLSNLVLIGIVPPKAAAELGERFGTNPIGTGPYKFVEYVPGSHVKAEVNQDYWGEPPEPQSITYRILSENATRLAALESGEVDLIDNLPPDAVERIADNPDLKVLAGPTNRLMHVKMRGNREPLSDVRVRQAANYAIDKESIVENIFGGETAVAKSCYHPSIPCFDPQDPYTFDPDRAKELLSEAGYSDGVPILFSYTTGRYLMDKQVGEAITAMLQDVGFEVEVEAGDYSVVRPKSREGTFDAFQMGWAAASLDPDYVVAPFLPDVDNFGYAHQELADMIQEASQVFDMDEACTMYEEIQEMIWEDAPWIFLHYVPAFFGASKDLQGFTVRSDSWYFFWDVTKD
jgi:peptide/nickel transport system substrate-binding protein